MNCISLLEIPDMVAYSLLLLTFNCNSFHIFSTHVKRQPDRTGYLLYLLCELARIPIATTNKTKLNNLKQLLLGGSIIGKKNPHHHTTTPGPITIKAVPDNLGS